MIKLKVEGFSSLDLTRVLIRLAEHYQVQHVSEVKPNGDDTSSVTAILMERRR